MKFQFEGYEYKDDKDYIEIDFDFMEKSEFIRVLEPDLTIPIMIPERFEKYQIDEFKKILEKMTRKEELTDGERHLCKSEVIIPLLEYFKMDEELINEMDFPKPKIESSVKIEFLEKGYDDDLWAIKMVITSNTFRGSFRFEMRRRDGNIYLADGREFWINIEEFNMVEGINEKYNSFSVSMDGDEDYDTIEFEINRGKMNIGHDDRGGLEFKIEISNPEEFLKSLYKQLKEITEE